MATETKSSEKYASLVQVLLSALDDPEHVIPPGFVHARLLKMIQEGEVTVPDTDRNAHVLLHVDYKFYKDGDKKWTMCDAHFLVHGKFGGLKITDEQRKALFAPPNVDKDMLKWLLLALEVSSNFNLHHTRKILRLGKSVSQQVFPDPTQ